MFFFSLSPTTLSSCLRVCIVNSKLFVGGLHTSTTEQTLKDYFSKYGLLREVNLKTDAATNKSRFVCFVFFGQNLLILFIIINITYLEGLLFLFMKTKVL
jgi:hypothetical protein